MPNPFSTLDVSTSGKPVGPNRVFQSLEPLDTSTAKNLQQQEEELRALQQQSGARDIEQDKPGALARIIDFLSRPNLAIAGFSEELFGGDRSVTKGVQRALTEIFSGVGGIEGEKRAFGEVLERLGVGTKTLADAFPALEGTWVGNFGSRGAAGLALDIATDPLTYVTFGAGTGIRVTTSKGIRYLNRAGNKLRGELMDKNVKAARKAIKGTDDIAEGRIWDRATFATDKEFEQLYGAGGEIASELLEPGGAKLFGRVKIPGSDKIGVPLRKTMQMLPDSITGPAIEGAQQMKRGMLRMVNGIFSPEGALSKLPQPIRNRAVQLTNSFFRSSLAHRMHLMEQMAPLQKIYRKLEKKSPGIGERWYDVRERIKPLSAITDPKELEAFNATMALYESMGKTLVDHGVLDDTRILKNYIFHQYKNVEDLSQYHPRPGVKKPGSRANFAKERKFESFRVAQEETKRLHELSLRLGARRAYPELTPEFDVFKNMETYIGQHADVLARKAWREEMVAQFGKSLDELGVNGADLDALYEVETLIKTPPAVVPLAREVAEEIPLGLRRKPVIDESLEGLSETRFDALRRRADETVDGLEAQFDELTDAEVTTEFKRKLAAAQDKFDAAENEAFRREMLISPTDELAAELRNLNMSLSTDKIKAIQILRAAQQSGREEKFLRAVKDIASRSPDHAEVMGAKISSLRQVIRDLKSSVTAQPTKPSKALPPARTTTTRGAPKEFNPERLPVIRAIDEGDIEKALVDTFGPDGAQYVAVKSKATANELAYLPKAIADSLDSVNSSLFNTAEYKEFGKLLKGFDWLNNNFKWGVYTVWIASMVRDGYSNLFLSGLRIGVNAISYPLHRDAIGIMAGRNLTKQFANSGFTRGQLKDLSKTFGVWVPGRVFVEQTGKFKLGKFRSVLTEKRSLIENEARMMLWLDEIRHGVDPRKAADTVGQFLFNYGEVSRVERDLFRRLIPFYTFTRKNVELQAKILLQNPGRVINQLKPFRGRQSENEQMVKFEAEGLKLRLDKDGKTLHAMTGIDVPLRNLDTIWAGGFGATGRRLMGMITPVLKVPLEATVGRDLFTGGDLKRTRADTLGRIVEATKTPQGVKDWLGYKKTVDEAGRPTYTMDGTRYALLVRSWMFSRAFSTSDRQFREYLPNRQISAALLDVLTGIRVKDLDLDQQAELKLRRRIRQLEQSLVRRGARAEFSRSFTPRQQGSLQ